MAPDSITAAGYGSQSDTFLRRILGFMSVFSMLMTIPQVWTIWVNHQAAGVSIASWSVANAADILPRFPRARPRKKSEVNKRKPSRNSAAR